MVFLTYVLGLVLQYVDLSILAVVNSRFLIHVFPQLISFINTEVFYA